MSLFYALLAIGMWVTPASWTAGSAVPASQAEAVAQIVGFIFAAASLIIGSIERSAKK